MLSSLLFGLAHVSNIIFNMLTLVVIASVLVSWVGADPSNPLVNMVYSMTEPMYRPIRRYTSRFGGPIDFAPMIVMLIVVFLEKSVPMYLMMLSKQLQ